MKPTRQQKVERYVQELFVEVAREHERTHGPEHRPLPFFMGICAACGARYSFRMLELLAQRIAPQHPSDHSYKERPGTGTCTHCLWHAGKKLRRKAIAAIKHIGEVEKDRDAFLERLARITAEKHEPADGHAYLDNPDPELSGSCLICGWLGHDMPALECGHTPREHAILRLRDIQAALRGEYINPPPMMMVLGWLMDPDLGAPHRPLPVWQGEWSMN